MSLTRWWVVLLVLTACSSKEAGDESNVLVKGSISPTTGAMIFHDEDPNVVLSIPPSAVSEDVDVTISAADADGDAEAVSPVIVVAPEETALSFPGSLSIAVETPTPTLVIARVTPDGLERLAESSVDATTHEVQAQVRRLGRFVVVDGGKAALVEAPSPSPVAGTPSAQPSSATGTAPGTVEIAGTWQGIGAHENFSLSLADSKFAVSKDGRVVREGSFSVTGNSLSLVDSSGKTELATVALADGGMTMESAQSGVVRWQRVGQPASAEVASGFFSTEPDQAADSTGAQTPPASQPPATAVAKAKTGSPKPPRSSTAPLASATPSSADTGAASTNSGSEPKKNIFQRIGSGLKSAGTGIVHGVQNLGKSNAQQTTQVAAETVAQGEQQLAAGAAAASAAATDVARAAAGDCDAIVGDWSWFLGGTVTFASGERVRWTPATGNNLPPAVGKWSCLPATRTYAVTWENGFIDTLNLAADGTQLSGVSSTGVKVSGRRISNAGVATSNSKTSPANTTTEGWTPIGDGGFGKQSTVPMSGGVPQRIGPQGRPPPKGAG